MVPPADKTPHPTPVSGAAGFLLIVACNTPITGGQTGDGSGVLPEPEQDIAVVSRPQCEYRAEPIGRDDETPGGLSVDDVLAFAEGSFESEIAWPDDPEATVRYGPRAAGAVQVDVRRRGARAQYLTPRLDAGAGSGCPPLLSVPVEVTIVTADGALDQTMATELRASSTDVATFSVTVPADELSGGLRLSEAPRGFELRSITFSGFLSPFGTAGSVAIAAGTAAEGSETSAQAALWPSEGCDEQRRYAQPEIVVAAAVRAAGRTARELLDAASDASPVPLRWSDGSDTTLEFGVEPVGKACVFEAGGSLRLRRGVEFALDSADGRLEGALAGFVTDVSAADEPLRVQLWGELDTVGAQLPDRLRLEGVGAEEFERVRAQLWLDVGDPPTGSFTVLGVGEPCSDPEPAAEPDLGCEHATLLDAGLGEFLLTEDEPVVP